MRQRSSRTGRTSAGVRQRVIVVLAGCVFASLAGAAPTPTTHVDTKSPARKTSPAVPSVTPAPDAEPLPLDLSPTVLRSAITAADEDYARPASKGTPFGRSPSPQAKTDRAFEAAEIGRCGGPDTLKFESLPVWGDFTIGGLFVIPYAIHAMATGRCKF